LLYSILAFLLFLIPLIFFHELGHFLFAKLFGIQVDVFSLGLGPKLFSFKWRGTEWKVCLFPIGGMVKMLGENAQKAQEIPEEEQSKSFYHLHPWKKILVAFGGPLFNILLALLILIPFFAMDMGKNGVELRRLPIVVDKMGQRFLLSPNVKAPVLRASLDDNSFFNSPKLYLHSMETKPSSIMGPILAKNIIDLIRQGFYPLDLQISKIRAFSPAHKLGMKSGDVIDSVDNKSFYSFENMGQYILSQKNYIRFKIWRQGRAMYFSIMPQNGKIGIYSAGEYLNISDKNHGATLQNNHQGAFQVMAEIIQDYGRLFSGKISIKELSGPLSISKMVTRSLDFGLAPYFLLMGIISFNLALVNLLPLPLLDGGHILFNLYEIFSRKTIPLYVHKYGNRLGLGFVILLFMTTFINDLKII